MVDDANTTGPGDPAGQIVRKAEDPLWSSAAMLSAAMDACGDLVAIKDTSLVLRQVNAAMARALGRPVADLVGKTDRDLFPDEVASSLERDDRTTLESGRTVTREQLLPTQAGLQWIQTRKDPVVLNGARVGVITVVRDISGRMEIEHRLRRSTALLDRFFSQSIFAVAYLDRRFSVLRVNETYAALAGQPPDALVGRAHFEIVPDAGLKGVCARVLETGEPFTAEARQISRPVGPNGTDATHWDVSVQPVRDAAGVIDGLILSLVDVTERERAQAALRASEARYRLIAENQSALIFKVNRENRFVYANRAYCETFGCQLEDLVGAPILDQVHDQDRPKVLAALETLRTPPHRTDLEFRAPTASGWRWLAWQITAVLDGDGRLAGMIGVGRDVSAQRQAEQALRDSERRYRLLAENATDIISTHTLEGVCTFVSPACRQVLACDPDEVLGTSGIALCHPDDRPRVEAAQRRILNTRGPGRVRYRVRHASGRYLWVETTSRAVRNPETGAPIEIVAVTRDVASQVRDQDSLRRSRLLYKGLFDGSSAPMLLVDPDDGRILRANAAAARFYGYDSSHLRSLSIEAINALPKDEVQAARQRALTQRQSVFEFRHRLASGALRDVMVHSTPLDLQGRTVLFSIVQDITERKAAEAALRQSEHDKALILSSISDVVAYFERDDLRMTWTNAAVRQSVAADTDALTGPPCYATWAGRESPCPGCPVVETFRTGRPAEADQTTPDGRVWSLRAFPAFDETGVLKGVVEVRRDITDQKASEDAVQRSLGNLNACFSLSRDLLAVVARDGRIVEANRTLLDRLGWARKDLIGNSVLALRPAAHQEEAAADLRAMLAGTADVLTRPLATRDGRLVPAETRIAQGTWNDAPVLFTASRDLSDLALSEEKFKKAFTNNATLMAITDPETGRFVEANTALLRTIGRRRAEVIGRTSVELGLFSTQAIRDAVTREAVSYGGRAPVEYRFTRPDGSPFIGEMTAECITSGETTYLLSMVVDVTHQRALLAEPEHKATHDALTGLFNRQEANRHLDTEVRRAERLEMAVSLVMIDVDHFKVVNDTHGHPTGDRVLCEVADRLAARVRETDLLARWGGEEFLVILPGTEAAGAVQLAETLRAAMEEEPIEAVGPMTISLGVAQHRPGETVPDWVSRADAALYAAKAAGRNQLRGDG
ncbi:sensor domain-containing diguanylate cyclase [Roseospira navarrensis]|nr:PAS domain S-box protein [Roseospira navarrensis]